LSGAIIVFYIAEEALANVYAIEMDVWHYNGCCCDDVIVMLLWWSQVSGCGGCVGRRQSTKVRINPRRHFSSRCQRQCPTLR